MKTKARKFTYDADRRLEQTIRRNLMHAIREAISGDREPLLSRSDALTKEIIDLLDRAGKNEPRPSKVMEDHIVALTYGSIKKERAALAPGKRLPKGRRKEILDEIVGALAVAGELHQLPISMENVKRELDRRSPKRRRPPSTRS
jgi:hypothetical protein